MRVSRHRLAQWVGTNPERIDELEAHRLIEPDVDGHFDRSVVHVARLMLALVDSGIAPSTLREALERESFSVSLYSEWFPPQPPSPGRPFQEFLTDAEVEPDSAGWLYQVFGLAAPDPARRIDDEEQTILWELLGVMDELGDRELLRRTCATYAIAASDAVEKVLALYAERLAEVSAQQTLQGDGIDPLLEPWSRMSRMSPRLLAWLYRRHLEAAIDSFSVTNVETYLAELGYVPPRPATPQAVVFVDIAGYTSISEQEGDLSSALLGTGVGDMAASVSSRHGGRLVKLLGDGAMLHFATASSAVDAACDMLDAAKTIAMPALHLGVNAGPMVYRDGDYYGHTVNTAARLCAAAPAGEIYATEAVAAATTHPFAAAGDHELKGISHPVTVYTLRACPS